MKPSLPPSRDPPIAPLFYTQRQAAEALAAKLKLDDAGKYEP